jgi:putative resolvase
VGGWELLRRRAANGREWFRLLSEARTLGSVKLSEWAGRNGVSRQTAARWFHAGELPVPARQLPSGTILVDAGGVTPPVDTGVVALYARVSSADQKSDLDRQLGRLVAHASAQGLTVARTVTEVGSGLNGARPKLRRLLADPSVSTIVVEHRDRLARFGVEYLEAALAAQGRRIVVVDDAEVDDDLVRDVTEVLTSLCARLYGRRWAARRAAKALEAAGETP